MNHTYGFYMKIMLLEAPTLTFLFATIILLWVYWKYAREKNDAKIPGPKLVDRKLGHIKDIIAAGNLSQYLRQMHKKYGSVVRFYQGQTYVVSLGSPSAFSHAKRLFDRPETMNHVFRGVIGPGSVGYQNGEAAKKRIAAYTKFFSYSNSSTYYPVMQKRCVDICKSWLSQEGPVEVARDIQNYAMMSTKASIFGGHVPDPNEIQDFIGTFEEAWTELEKRMAGDIMEPGSKREKQLKDCLSKIDSNVLDSLKEAIKHDSAGGKTFADFAAELKLDEQTILDDVFTFIIGGYHNSSYVLEWGMYFLAKYPSIQEKMNKEITEILGNEPVSGESMKHLVYVNQFLDEIQRWVNVSPLNMRISDEEIEIEGYRIPANIPIVLSFEAVHFNESIYPYPENIDPERFSPDKRKLLPPLSLVPFGFAGGRKCVGWQLFNSLAIVLLTTVVGKLQLSLPHEDAERHKDIGTFSRPDKPVRICVKQRRMV